ncbi:MAG TPA: hypothetical protein VG742_10225 [Dongiaceae bacterium]|nr:hypothetical protein [Dongiaceae bacterium]
MLHGALRGEPAVFKPNDLTNLICRHFYLPCQQESQDHGHNCDNLPIFQSISSPSEKNVDSFFQSVYSFVQAAMETFRSRVFGQRTVIREKALHADQ